MYADMTV